MDRVRNHRLLAGLSIIAVAGCRQYLGYRVESTREVSREECATRRGQPRELKVEFLKSKEPTRSVTVQVTAVSKDWVVEEVVMEEERTHVHGNYQLLMDLAGEPMVFLVSHVALLLPERDLIARLCGATKTIAGEYEEHPPPYFRRVLHWFSWAVPGYMQHNYLGLGDPMRLKMKTTRGQGAEVRRVGQLRRRRQECPASGAAILVSAATSGKTIAQATVGSDGCASLDLSQSAVSADRGEPMATAVRALYRGLEGSVQTTLDLRRPTAVGVELQPTAPAPQPPAEAKPLAVAEQSEPTRETRVQPKSVPPPKPKPAAPPGLVVKPEFKDPDDNGLLDAREVARILVNVTNKGKGDALSIAVKPGIEGDVKMVKMEPKGPTTVACLPPEQEHSFAFTVEAEEEVPTQRVRARFEFSEKNGFEPQPVIVTFETKPYDKPELVVAKWEIDDDSLGLSSGNDDGVVQRGEKVEITVFVQNRGAGVAEAVTVDAKVTSPNLFLNALQADLGDIEPGKWAKAVVTLMVNNRYEGTDAIPMQIKVIESRPRFGLEAPIEIPLGRADDGPQVVEVTAKRKRRPFMLLPLPGRRRVARPRPTSTPAAVYALVIGISEYGRGVPRLEYAEKDARDVHDLLVAQGVSPDNIKLLTDGKATKTAIQVATRSWLSRAKDATALIHWSGHGFLDRNNPGQGYFACYDTPGSAPTAGYKMTGFTDDIQDIEARHVVMFLDTCHAGRAAFRENRGIGGIATGPANDFAHFLEQHQRVSPGMVIIAAGDTDRKALESSDWENGMLTHVTLRALKGGADGYQGVAPKDGTVTLGELKAYVGAELPTLTTSLGMRACFPVIATLKGDDTTNRLPLARVKE